MVFDMWTLKHTLAHEHPEKGMSLIEVLVSLVVTSLILTLTIQSGVRLVEQWRIRDTEKQIVQSFEQVRRTAMGSRVRMIMTANDIVLPDSADNWTVELSEALVFSKSGLCNSGVLTIVVPERRPSTYTIAPPGCVPDLSGP